LSEILRKGRLGSARGDVAKFTSSIKSDERLLKHVVDINKAHIIMLTSIWDEDIECAQRLGREVGTQAFARGCPYGS